MKKTMRYRYLVKFAIRCVILFVVFILLRIGYDGFDILDGMCFFSKFTLLHILWILWMIDMIQQFIPARNVVSLGSQKLFLMHFVPSNLKKTKDELITFIKYSHYANLKVACLWIVLVLGIWQLSRNGIIGAKGLFLIITLFYVCDLVCVLFWCPFRVFLMKNRCCATCTIFNWDHIMMFSPCIFIGGFYAWSLFAVAAAVFIIWEIMLFIHPERFWEETNEALKCVNCKEYLCGNNMHAVGITTHIDTKVIDKAIEVTGVGKTENNDEKKHTR